MAFLGLIIGPMMAEKTTELLRQVRMQRLLGKDYVVLVPDIDTRVEKTVFTHNGHVQDVEVIKVPHKTLSQYTPTSAVVAIDEGQFFVDLVPAVTKFLAHGCIVWVAGLSGDFQRRSIGDILALIPMADQVVHLRALCLVCKDGARAPFTKRLDSSNDAVVDIGDGAKYVAVCRKHFD